ncbi:MAG: ABC transporter permease [Muribaculaceae bacterium]|nr:ABC transporter permease [Muribaculaceae bacterium]
MFKFFTSDLRRNIIKILCLSIGLSIGLLLVARVYFDKSYDTFSKDADRTYVLNEIFDKEGKYSAHPTLSGGYIPAFAKDIPQIEVATRFFSASNNDLILLPDGQKLRTESTNLTDENIFDLFNVPVTGGNPKEILTTENQCIIPRSLAEKIGCEVIGSTFILPGWDEKKKITIGGIYEDFPLNSTIPKGIYYSMSTFPGTTQGKDGFEGNDVYRSYIRLIPGVTFQDIKPAIREIINRNASEIMLTTFHYDIDGQKISGVYAAQDSIKTMDLMLTLLAIILLLGSSLNFLLIVIGQVDKRGKEMSVRKCYGTSNLKIFGRVMRESLFYLVVSAFIGILTVFCFPSLCNRLLGYTPDQLFTTGNVWIVVLEVCLVLLILTGVIPAWIYCRTPVASAFRGNVKGRRGWKMALLSIQFFSAGVLLCLLVLVGRQYHMLMTVDNGYDSKNIAYAYMRGTKYSGRSEFVSELKNLSFVENVSTARSSLGDGLSGNLVWINGDAENVINVGDNYDVNANFFEMMGIEFIQGETFNVNADSTINQVVVEKSFVDVLKKLSGKDEEFIVGKTFRMSEHGLNEYTICGVINDIRRGGLTSLDDRAGVWFPSSRSYHNIYIKLTEITPENIRALQDVVDRMFPSSEIEVTTLQSELDAKIIPIKNFATSVMIAGVAILFIALIGLIGYTGDEVQRRSKEIAIRKVSGTSARQIISLFLRNTLVIAIPSMIVGGAVAMIAGRKWLSQFAEQVPISPLSMILCLVVLLLIISAVTVYNTLGVASSNPVNHLRNE